MKKELIFLIIMAWLNIHLTTEMSAQGCVQHTPGSSVCFSENSIEMSDGVFNYSCFTVAVPTSGYYYLGAWILPIQLNTGDYMSYDVYVNRVFIGKITPNFGNWQSLGIDKNKSFFLSKGLNNIEFALPSPNISDIEKIVVSSICSDAVISGEKYDAFLLNAKNESIVDKLYYDVSEYLEDADVYADVMTTNSEEVISQECALLYSFFKRYTYVQDQQVIVSTNSKVAHTVDIMYIGYYKDWNINEPLPMDSTFFGNLNGKNTTADIVDYYPHPETQKIFVAASSEEMQGLTYSYRSEKSKNSQEHIISRITTIPKDGVYLVRIRTTANSIQGLVDVNIDGKYYHENMPISLSYIECVMPRYEEYVSLTISNNDTDNPMLFIHGVGDKVVGYNNDTNLQAQRKYGQTAKDAYISQIYKYNTKGVSVSSFGSASPVSTCNVITRLPKGTDIYNLPKKISDNDNTLANISTIVSNDAVIRLIDDAIYISSGSKIQKISLIDMNGRHVYNGDWDVDNVVIPVNAIRTGTHGIYIIIVYTADGCISKRIIL